MNWFSFFALYFVVFTFSLIGLDTLPVLYNGRVRPLEAYGQIWLQETYQNKHLSKQHLEEMKIKDISTLIWMLHLNGFESYQSSPLFFVKSLELKRLGKLDLNQTHFSYKNLQNIFFENEEISEDVFTPFLIYHAIKSYLSLNKQSKKVELSKVYPGLWVRFNGSQLIIDTIPLKLPWSYFKPGHILLENIQKTQFEEIAKKNKGYAEELESLIYRLKQFESITRFQTKQEFEYQNTIAALEKDKISSKEIEHILETRFPLKERLSGSFLKVLPGRYSNGEWFSLHALKTKVYKNAKLEFVSNFTLFSDKEFDQIRILYLEWEQAALKEQQNASLLLKQLTSAIEIAYTNVHSSSFPSHLQLKVEAFYYHYPMIEIAITLYSITLIILLIGILIHSRLFNRIGLILAFSTFCLHSAILLMRCYILNRPPVTNMFETVIYVPWITVLFGLIFGHFTKQKIILIVSLFGGLLLLAILQTVGMNNSLENVQPVLNSQFWLMVHVLMVVGSYGIFLLCGLLGHYYLGSYIRFNQETTNMKVIAKLILQTMYLGTAFLISGTLLGGVWAAESWGRFWDWDPKESWAFISSCMYLIGIHAYRFNKVKNFGLAISSIIGFLAISFTWYGVNYILGTGLHSYGFGFGGQEYYFYFLIFEILFIIIAFACKTQEIKKLNQS